MVALAATAAAAALILAISIQLSHQTCHHTTVTFYRQVADDFWAMQKIRESLFTALRDTQSQKDSSQSYSSVTAILDGLRRRTIDLYPVLQDLPKLRTCSPQQQAESILETFTDQRFIGCAAELAYRAVHTEKLIIEKNLTRGLDHIQARNRAVCSNEILDIFWSYFCTCPPTQPLIGGILVNTPVRMSVSDIRLEVSNMLRDSNIEADVWRDALKVTDPRNQTLTQWLAELLRTIANQTSEIDATNNLSDGIIQIASENEEELATDDEIALRIHPRELDTAGFFIQPTQEERGIYRIGPPAQSSKNSKEENSALPRTRRNAIKLTGRGGLMKQTLSMNGTIPAKAV